MPRKERVAKERTHTTRVEEPEAKTPQSNEQKKKLKQDLDDLLDEIDELLEPQAEEFVKSYVQKGGE